MRLALLRPLALVSVAGWISAGCDPTTPSSQPAERTVTARSLGTADAVNALGLDLAQRGFRAADNSLISPASISTALAMTLAGATGETSAAMASTLHLANGLQATHDGYKELLAAIDGAPQPGGYEVSVVNRLFGERTMTFKNAFLDTTRLDYGAELAKVDFRGAPEPSRVTINDWVETETHGRIKDLLPQGTIDPSTSLALVNAVYFKAEWAEPFVEDYTGDATFTLADGTTKQAPFMNNTGMYRHLEDASLGVEVLEMPYANGDAAGQAEGASMLIFLPSSAASFAGFTSGLTADAMKQLVDRLYATSPEHLVLQMPKWTFTSDSISLKDALTGLGMGRAFDASRAEFDGIAAVSPERLFLQDVMHKTFIAVTEHGTEAAGATGVIVGTTSAPGGVFRADRPFLYAIRDNATGTFLFLGTMADPTI